MLLAVNAWDDPKDVVETFARDNGLKHTILLDGRTVAERYGVSGIPATFWIDAQGRVVARDVGFHPGRFDAHTGKLMAPARSGR